MERRFRLSKNRKKHIQYGMRILLAFLIAVIPAACGSNHTITIINADENEKPNKNGEFEVSVQTIDPENQAAEEDDAQTQRPVSEGTEPEFVSRVTITAIGDMLMHTGCSKDALQPDGSYNYDYIFSCIADEINAADIAVVNNEAIFGGNQLGIRTYPQFNVRTELGDAEVKAGFDLILNANNHTMDQNAAGVQNTLDFWKKYPEINVIGINETQEDQDRLHIIDKNGIKIAVFNYSYGLNNYGNPYDRPYLVNLMNDSSRERIGEEIRRAETEADFTIVFPHWGEEYHLYHSGQQEAWAKYFTECGADLIIGSHSHCLQEIRTIIADNGNQSLCYYSLGNYVGLQDHTISQLGGMAKVTINKTGNRTFIEDHSLRTMVNHYYSCYNGPYTYYLEDYTDELAAQHGINVDRLPDVYGFKPAYPMSTAGMHAILRTIGEE